MPAIPSPLYPLPFPKGFTLLEIIITILILSLTGLSLGFSFLRYQEKQYLGQTSEKVVSYLRDTQNRSILAKKASSYGVRLSHDQLEIIEYPTNPPSRTLSDYQLPKSLKLTSLLHPNQNLLKFTKISGNPDSSGDLQLSSAHYLITITITNNGQISVSKIQKK